MQPVAISHLRIYIYMSMYIYLLKVILDNKCSFIGDTVFYFTPFLSWPSYPSSINIIMFFLCTYSTYPFHCCSYVWSSNVQFYLHQSELKCVKMFSDFQIKHFCNIYSVVFTLIQKNNYIFKPLIRNRNWAFVWNCLLLCVANVI
jgi:hypothetical protein